MYQGSNLSISKQKLSPSSITKILSWRYLNNNANNSVKYSIVLKSKHKRYSSHKLELHLLHDTCLSNLLADVSSSSLSDSLIIESGLNLCAPSFWSSPTHLWEKLIHTDCLIRFLFFITTTASASILAIHKLHIYEASKLPCMVILVNCKSRIKHLNYYHITNYLLML